MGVLLVCLCLIAMFAPCPCKTDSWSWKDCSGKDDTMKILKVSLSKNTGDFNVSYSLEKRVVNGNVSVNVTYGVVPSYFNTISLCKIFKCPVEKGNGTFALSNPIEPYFHPGDYTLYAVVRNMENAELACIKVEVIKKSL
ncbi:Putative phosphatidylglycerol/phosphatidylinositol transfer protein DDB_G0278295 [Geodia barretti]|uniref:Phosphatidylglycerol/phosphatidylinositol transfer protein DDB_G0278295 n=1 Tax=Geodia barretti TaxID=519541 RepID=A0AA35SJN8_GEOBA|nr:Putative phosphatidylglycerol/phosphatidylinositol transfer protein DDB_G0278295 [Geodia barretti]